MADGLRWHQSLLSSFVVLLLKAESCNNLLFFIFVSDILYSMFWYTFADEWPSTSDSKRATNKLKKKRTIRHLFSMTSKLQKTSKRCVVKPRNNVTNNNLFIYIDTRNVGYVHNFTLYCTNVKAVKWFAQ